MSNLNNHTAICESLTDMYAKKNADYGNSFSEQFAEHGLVSSVIRLDDKMRRLKQLTNNKQKVADESIVDTLMDMANYAIMTLMELEESSHVSCSHTNVEGGYASIPEKFKCLACGEFLTKEELE